MGSSTPLQKEDKEECLLIKSELVLHGRDKWLGGELGPDKSTIYCVPGTAGRILRICSTTDTLSYVGPPLVSPITTCSLRRNEFKWLRGICVGNSIYCLPANADSILKITHAPTPEEVQIDFIGGPFLGIWKWHGGALSPHDNNIYCIPCNSTSVLKIDTTTDVCTVLKNSYNVDTKEAMQERQKWYGGLVGDDGCIYGIPNSATSVLKINPADETVELMGPVPPGQFKWHGGVVSRDSNGDVALYGVPSHYNAVLKIVPRTGKVALMNCFEETLHDSMPKGRVNGGKYKYGGAVVDPESFNVYCFPSDACRVLKINVKTQVCSVIGPYFENFGFNKWQNGYYKNGYIYAIPCNANKILRIHPASDTVDLVGEGWEGIEKWEGGVEANGSLYCVPQQETRVLKITPLEM